MLILLQEEGSTGQKEILKLPQMAVRTAPHPAHIWSYCEVEMGGMEYQVLQAEMERMER